MRNLISIIIIAVALLFLYHKTHAENWQIQGQPIQKLQAIDRELQKTTYQVQKPNYPVQ